MPRITSQKTRQMLLVTGDPLSPDELPEKLELFNDLGQPLALPRHSRHDEVKSTAALTAAVDTGNLVTRSAGGGESGTWDLGHGVLLTHISVNRPCRVRLYPTAIQRNADVVRSRYTDPADRNGPSSTPNHGCLTEFLLLTTLALDNVPVDYLTTAPGEDVFYYRIDNYDIAAGIVTVTLTVKDVEE